MSVIIHCYGDDKKIQLHCKCMYYVWNHKAIQNVKKRESGVEFFAVVLEMVCVINGGHKL